MTINPMLTQLAKLSLEERQDEVELEIYVKKPLDAQVPSGVVLTEQQTQYSFFLEGENRTGKGNMRVRETIVHRPGQDPEISYEYCCKVFKPDGTKDENSYPVDRALFEQFLLLADSGMSKVRHVVPVDSADYVGLKFEVDAFKNSPWVKIDLEVNDRSQVTSLTDEVIATLLGDYLTNAERHFIVRPSDKANGTAVAEEAHALMQEYGVLKGPFSPI